ncbi:helix-turn-helix transcriptional regulator [Gelidibacter gilvus]|uniref:AraC family transcriptional regulator n=1 Tax=Gelidibacter gilvus TaxID=59602 RepID=A0A4Q0XEF5_9FLAO|nr:AraC family transcriptional regulator [Gelidibacter gilvus]RXJ44362.1 AraC family transcriptional regulator [Gelidibacter gilvus]
MNYLSSVEINENQSANKRCYDGHIEKFVFTNSLECYGIKLKSHQDSKINFQSQYSSAIYVCVNLSSNVSLQLSCEKSQITIPPFASLLVPFQEAENISFKCKSLVDYDFLVLKVYQSHLDEDHLKLLQNLQKENVFLNPFTSQKRLIPNLAICEMARKLKHLDYISSENKFMARGYINIIIGMKFKEILCEQSSISNHLSGYEIQQLEMITAQIKENPQEDYTINDLCKKSGLSVSKLQAGFKEKHGCTVTIHIRNVRLEKALTM